MDLLIPSDLTTQCPYKVRLFRAEQAFSPHTVQGVANYYNVRLPSGEVVQNIVWWYRTPQPECGEIKGFAAFYDEKVDVWVDGVKQQRPVSHF